MPSIAGHKARQRSRLLAEHLGLSMRRAQAIRVEAEREMADAAVAAAGDSWQQYSDALDELLTEARALLKRAKAKNQLNAAAGFLKQLHALHQDRARWGGAKPRDPENDNRSTRPVIFEFGGGGDAGS